ncbi:MAG: hypothetical protein CVU08_14970 [Bacteroidetes bacterium HGW-Bacteroidetes-3]|nr:MAG: hypothetical protein CVU08_14970 [Bacteroidetes bacterium HGW-Bacteroidetes-3]
MQLKFYEKNYSNHTKTNSAENNPNCTYWTIHSIHNDVKFVFDGYSFKKLLKVLLTIKAMKK